MSLMNISILIKILERTIVLFLVFLIKVYKDLISPILPLCCRFNPTCSSYCCESLQRYGLFKGLHLSIYRLLRCHPFGGYGEDPVP